MARIHQGNGVGSFIDFKFRAIGILVNRMYFVMGYDHLLHENFGMLFPDIVHQLSGAFKEQIDIRLVSAVPEYPVLLSGGNVKGFVRNAGFRGFDTVCHSAFYGRVVKLVGKGGAFLLVLIGGEGKAAVKQGAEQGEFPSVHVKFVFFLLRHGVLGLLGAGIRQQLLCLFGNSFYVCHV